MYVHDAKGKLSRGTQRRHAWGWGGSVGEIIKHRCMKMPLCNTNPRTINTMKKLSKIVIKIILKFLY